MNTTNCKKCKYPKDSGQHRLCKENSRKADRLRAAFDKENGRCTNCRYPFDSEEHKICKSKKNERLKSRRAKLGAEICKKCLAPYDSNKHIICKENNNKKRQAVRKLAIEKGMCRNHTLRPATIGQMCVDCWFASIAGTSLGDQKRGPEIKLLLESQNALCPYTKVILIPGKNASLDHKLPSSRGGSHELGNLQWTTRQINNMKTDFTHEEFILMCNLISRATQNG